MRYDLSVIVPTFNNLTTIERCIESILDNKINIEIIVVDDFSSCDIFPIVKKYDNIKYIRNDQNMGVSHSRNVGLDNVSSDYFAFVDADDYLEPSSLDYLLDVCYENDLDVCGFNYFRVDKKKKKSKYIYDGNILNNDQLIDLMLKDKVSLVIFDKIYKYSVFKNLKFNESLKVNEDYDYAIRAFQLSNRSMFLNEYFYNYCFNGNSLSHNYLCSQIESNNYYVFLDLSHLIGNKNFVYFDCCLNVKLMHLFLQCKDRKNRYSYLTKNIDRNKLKSLLDYEISFRLKLEIYLYLFNIRLYLILFDIYRGIFYGL